MDVASSIHEEDSLKDSSVELTVHTEWMNRIHSQGNRPEDWVEFIHYLKEQSPVPVTNSWTAYICDQYVHALKTIPSNQNKNNIMFVKLLVDYATLKSEENVDNGKSLFCQARSVARKFAIAHIYAAEFELKYGNPSKCHGILKKAQTFRSEPQYLLQKALDNLDSGKSYLLTAEEKAACFDVCNRNLKPEEKPTIPDSYLPVGTVKNKFLASLATSNGTVLSESKPRQLAKPEIPVKKDSDTSPEEFICGSILALSEKWGCLNQQGPFARRFSHISDRRVSNVHTPLDKCLSSTQGSTDPVFIL
ncbi:dual specificity protein kinase TTK-like [Octopus sinensis]|uniref:Dual specificity protein kinase TTK-like n=1 Tax=Octopus sinensis TaxID=2607531 RepID=A0A7E6FCW7_9MOLL|nr:dual specificity protein kinase TTK-like [Octopus sinensis]